MQLQAGPGNHDGLVDQGMSSGQGEIVEVIGGIFGETVADGKQSDGLGFPGKCRREKKAEGEKEDGSHDCTVISLRNVIQAWSPTRVEIKA